MDEHFEIIRPEDISENIFKLVNEDWMLICAGKPDHYNMMTASWGGAGFLWKKYIAIIFIRPQRHTFLFVENSPFFTINFFDEKYRHILNYCGTKSGRDVNKMAIDGLEPVQTPSGNTLFKQARMVFECKKIYNDDIKPENFLSFDVEKIYSKRDYHRFYIGEIINIWKSA